MREFTQGCVIKRRGKWQGQVKYRLEDGTVRSLTKMLLDANSKPIPCSESSNKGKAIAEKALMKWRSELIEADQAAEAKAAEEIAQAEEEQRRVLLADYADRYIDLRASMESIEQSTARDYRKAAKLIRSEFADVAIQDLTMRMVKEFEIKLLKGEQLRNDPCAGMRSKLSGVTVAKCHRFLKMVLKHAQNSDGVVTKNVVDGVKPPKRETTEKNVLDPASCARLIEAIATVEPTPTVTGAALALLAGLGPGEACGLQWRCVDLESETPSIRIEQAVGYSDNGDYLKAPKVKTRRRTIPLPAQLRDNLERRKALCIEQCKQAGTVLRQDMYVLGDVTGAFYSPRTLSRSWTAFAESLGLKGTISQGVKFYDLRHHYATALLAAGADVKSVSSLMGHANANMTLNVYAQADPEAQRLAVSRLEARHQAVKAFKQKEQQTGTDN